MHTSSASRNVNKSGSRFIFFLVVWSAVLQIRAFAQSSENGTYLLGFLAPSPGASIPENLAIEWRSAFEVALAVLNNNRSYTLVPHVEDSECSYSSAQEGAERMLQQKNLVGAVGPACSDAVIGAANIFDEKGPAALVSFAATSEPLSNRQYYPTFFRTVYSDKYQAMAVAASIEKLSMKNVTLLHTKDFYSKNLAININQTVGGVRTILLEPGKNSTVDRDQLKGILNSLEPSDFVVLVVQPSVAEDIWNSAFEMGKTSFPWWYFGTDGATAFDPVGADSELVSAIQGEIGLAPYGGDFSSNSKCAQFYDQWQNMAAQHPGLPALGANKSRSYVPYLFDAVTAFYKALDGLEEEGLEFTPKNVYLAFNGSGGSEKISFDGCTGLVEFDPDTGARSVVAQPPVYDLVSLTVHSWELKGRVENSTFETLDRLDRPGGFPAPGQSYFGPNPHNGKISGGLIAGIVFLIVAIIVLVVACFVHYAKKRKDRVFFRIT